MGEAVCRVEGEGRASEVDCDDERPLSNDESFNTAIACMIGWLLVINSRPLPTPPSPPPPPPPLNPQPPPPTVRACHPRIVLSCSFGCKGMTYHYPDCYRQLKSAVQARGGQWVGWDPAKKGAQGPSAGFVLCPTDGCHGVLTEVVQYGGAGDGVNPSKTVVAGEWAMIVVVIRDYMFRVMVVNVGIGSAGDGVNPSKTVVAGERAPHGVGGW